MSRWPALARFFLAHFVVCGGLALLLLVASCAAPSPPAAPADRVVFVVGRGWHTDVGVPADEIEGPLASLTRRFPGVRVLTFGFGERQFLLARKPSLLGMASALLPSQSALLVTALRTEPEEAFGAQDVVRLRVSRAGLAQIEASLWRELTADDRSEPMELAEGPYPGSVFYAARQTYDLSFTCNTWTAATLRSGGIPMAVTGVLFSGQVMGRARWIAARP